MKPVNPVITAKVRKIYKDGFETDHTRYRHAHPTAVGDHDEAITIPEKCREAGTTVGHALADALVKRL
jgi:hypothetical protein